MIPEKFHSFETSSAFNSCCDCGCELLVSAQTYMIQKSFSKGECVLEFALCYSCKEKLDQQISAESKEAIYDFLFDNSDVLKQSQGEYSFDEAMQQIEVCLTCNKERKDCEGYTYSGLFVGTQLVTGPLPMMICEECQGELAENLSDHTRNVKEKFYAENFPGPPSEADLPATKPIFL
jgi:hypothetical protein